MSKNFNENQEDDLGNEDFNFEKDNQDSKENIESIDSSAIVKDQQAITQMESSIQEDEARLDQTIAKDATSNSKTIQETTSNSKFFAIRTTGGQERVVANQIQVRVNAKKIGIRSVMVLDSFKGYIIIEAPDSNVAYEGLAGIRHVRGQIRGDLPFKDIEGYLVKKPVVSELNVEDTVEVIAGPFKSMKAKITRVDYEKQEATVVLLDSPYQIPVTVDANYLKKMAH
jgi:transcriptional antiterminator NusG